MGLSSIIESLTAQLGAADAEELAAVLTEVEVGARRALGDDLVGVYLTGSFALGAGDLASDVDFLVVAKHALSSAAEEAARELHSRLPLRDDHWARHLEGSWVDRTALRDPVGAHAPWLYVDNGSRLMEHSRHDDSWNARWVLRHAGLAVVGPPASELLPHVPPARLKAEAAEQADLRAAWIQDEPSALLDGWAQPYVVLTHCRLLWAAAYGTVTSKGEAANWVREQVAPPEFRALIASAVEHRWQPFDVATQKADPRLAEVTAAFVFWATREVHERAT